MPRQTRGVVYENGDWEIDLHLRQLRRGRSVVPIGGRAFDIVAVLVESAGALVSKAALANLVWQGGVVEDNTLQVHISAIRQLLGSDRGLLKTASGRGYRMLGDWKVRRDEIPVGNLDLAPQAGPTFQSNLPQPSSELIGRRAALDQLRNLMSAYRLVTLTGPGGIGKTRLAQELAYSLRPSFDNDVQFVELASISNPDLVPSAIASILGQNLADDKISPAALARAIAGRRLLLVIDNCEHVIDAAARCIETILRHCERTSILATSRELLGIDGEYPYRVAPLNVPREPPQDLKSALDHGAVALFTIRMKTFRTDFDLEPGNLHSVISICRRLDGNPLAIELAAARSATLGVEQVMSRLDNRFAILTGGRRTALPRHRTLRAMLDWSYDLLPGMERTTLQRIAVFAGGFTLEAACAVAARTEADTPEIADAIVSLVAKSLISVDPSVDRPRYEILETVRAYALEKLAEADGVHSAKLRHARYFQVLFQQAEAERGSRPISDWLTTYGPEIDNVRTAIDWAFAVDDGVSMAVELSAATIPMMFDLSLVGEGRRRAEQALSAMASGVTIPQEREMRLLAVLQATRIYTDGPSEVGFDAWHKVLNIATEIADFDYRARALWGLWNDHLYGGWPARSLEFARQFLDLAAQRTDHVAAATGEILGRRIIGTSLHFCGDQKGTRSCLEQVLSQYVRSDHRWTVLGSRLDQATVTRATLSRTLWLQGYPDQALRLADLAVQDAVSDDHTMSLLYVLVEAAIPLSLFAGSYELTDTLLLLLMQHAPRAGFGIWVTFGRCFRAAVGVVIGDKASGLHELAESVQELEATRFCAHLTMFLGVLAETQAATGAIMDGLNTVDRALARCESHGDKWFEADLLRIKSEILVLCGKEASAVAHLEQALDLSAQQGAKLLELRAATTLARLLVGRGNDDKARGILMPIYQWFTEGFDTVDLRASRELLNSLPAG